mgnify:CR=1 FL=1
MVSNEVASLLKEMWYDAAMRGNEVSLIDYYRSSYNMLDIEVITDDLDYYFGFKEGVDYHLSSDGDDLIVIFK